MQTARIWILAAVVAAAWHLSGCATGRVPQLPDAAAWEQAREMLRGGQPPASDKFLEVCERLSDRLGPEAERRFCDETIARWPTYAAARFARARWLLRTGAAEPAVAEANVALLHLSRTSDAKLARQIECLLIKAQTILGRKSSRPERP